jgi:hypothetical protein
MATKFGVGESELHDSRAAGAAAAGAALANADLSDCDLALLFSTSRHDPVALRDGVRDAIGPAPRLIGGYSNGIITQRMLGYDGRQVGVAVMKSDSVKVEMFVEPDLRDRGHEAGLGLGGRIRDARSAGTPNVLLFYDFVRGPAGEGIAWNINFSTPLLAGLTEALGSWPPAAGMALMGDYQCSPGRQWFDGDVLTQTAMALVLSGGIRMDTAIMHGCKPASRYHRVTKTDGNVVLEIDGRPAIEVIAEMLGREAYEKWIEYPFFVTFGINRGDRFADFREEDYANRAVVGVDRERGGLVMFEPDLTAGTEVQLMRRTLTDRDYMRRQCGELLARLEGRTPLFAFYIDCAGRAAAYSGTDFEEASEIQRLIGPRMPLLGGYSGSEIANLGGHMQALVWTGVLCVFSEEA